MSSRLLAGRYELLEKIGDGGMAVVYKAKDKLLNRFIAIKILRPEFTKDASFVENFKRESQAAAGLSHQNIVGVYDVGREGNINYICMELIKGQTLNEIIREKAPMDYREVIRISKQVAAALSVAHKNKIIHRDIKPHNIMVTEDGNVKLADFGIAKAVNDATLSTGSRIIGSVHYFSPEQARGNYVDERSDIYSLGIVMYEMLTGKVPFDGDNPVTVALKHINEEIVPPSKLVDGIPPALEQCVMKATNKFQTNRFNSADELIEELDNIEFVTKVVGASIFNQASEAVEQQLKQNQPEEEDEEEVVVRKKKKKSRGSRWILPVVIGILILAGAGVFAAYRLGVFSDTKAAPDLTSRTLDQARAEAEKAGFEVKEGKEVYSSIAEGLVAEQNPEPGTDAKKGSTITVHLSKGAKEGIVPNLVGRSYEEIEGILGEDYVLGDYKEETSEQPQGTVLAQDPVGGSTADKGTRITVTISDGKGLSKSIVPSVTGKSLEDAKAEIERAGFNVGRTSYEESDVYGKGYVMWQQYAANTQLEKGTYIDIQVSKGAPKVIEEPEEDEIDVGNSDDTDKKTEEQKKKEDADDSDAGDSDTDDQKNDLSDGSVSVEEN